MRQSWPSYSASTTAWPNPKWRESDFLWQLSERFECGKPLGWFVEHEGDICQLDPFGEDGPHPTRAAAVQCMIEHLRAAIVRVRSWQRV
ncbi:MAG: hypothetical protein WB507_06425 [Solirubrobacterales bacterium]